MKYDKFIEYILTGREIELRYKGENYFISQSDKGAYIINNQSNEIQYYKDREELVEQAKIFGKALKQAWKDMVVDYVL